MNSSLLIELFKDKTIEDFFSMYHENEVFDIIEIIFHYNIKLFNKRFPTKASVNLIKRTLKDICYKLCEGSEDRLNGEKTRKIKKKTTFNTKNQAKKQELLENNQKKRVNSVKIFLKPSSNWRKGDDSIFKGNQSVNPIRNQYFLEDSAEIDKNIEKISQRFNNNIYPEWWQSLMNDESPKTSEKIEKSHSKLTLDKTPIEKSSNHSSSTRKMPLHYPNDMKTSEKGVEANFESHSSTENRVQFDKNTIKKFNSAEKKIIISPSYKITSNSSSSNSSFFPSPEMKTFYQNEFKRLFGPNFIEEFARKKKKNN